MLFTVLFILYYIILHYITLHYIILLYYISNYISNYFKKFLIYFFNFFNHSSIIKNLLIIYNFNEKIIYFYLYVFSSRALNESSKFYPRL